MNLQKICFIMCSNDKIQADECRLYIEQLLIPEGYEVEVLVVTEAASMTSGYNEAMNVSDAKYKVYLHHDVLILKPDFLHTMLALFQQHPEVGMFGVVGNESIAEDGGMWSDGTWRRTGEILVDRVYERDYSFFARAEGEFSEVITLDGLLMATQYDIPWREDLFQGWDYYDASQSVEFWKAGYKVVVPYMDMPWCLHENDLLNMAGYDKWRNVFVREYRDYYKKWMKEHLYRRKLPMDPCSGSRDVKRGEHKFCFIVCANNETYLEECLWYINRLSIPEGYETETIVIRGALSMTSGYNQAMEKSDAKYKIYLHQDVLILNSNILSALLDIFQEDSIGMVGVLGKKDFLPAAEYTIDWDTGGVEVCNATKTFYYNYNYAADAKYVDVVGIDGMFMATQYDLLWDEKNFDGWDFYDLSQAMNFAQAGFRIVVPRISRETIWCFHDNCQCEYYEWDKYRKIFCDLYAAKGYVYKPLDFIHLKENIHEKRQLAVQIFENGDLIKASQFLSQMGEARELDTQCSYILLFLAVLSEELFVLGYSSYEDVRKLPEFIDVWDEVKFILRRMYFADDSKELWQIIQDKLLSGEITMRLLCIAIKYCVFDSQGLWKIIYAHVQELLSSLIREGRVEKAGQMIGQLKSGEREVREKLLRRVIHVCQLEQEKGIETAILDYSKEVVPLIDHYVRMEWYIRQIEFGHFEMFQQEFYDYVTHTGASDSFILAIVMDDFPYRKKIYKNLAVLFAEKEGEHSVRAGFYKKLADDEEGNEIPYSNEKKFCFIICSDKEIDVKDSQWYLQRITVPEGFETEVIVIQDASSMANGYNRAMAQTDAKYKVYLHPGVRIVNQNIILDLLEMFQDPSIGMAGVLGRKEYALSAACIEWDAGAAEIYYGVSSQMLGYFENEEGKWLDVAGIDGMFMATQYDFLWEEDYDRSQCTNVKKAGYRIVVPRTTKADRWIFYDTIQCTDHKWDRCHQGKEVDIKRNRVWKVFEEGDFEQANERLKQLGEDHLDDRLSLAALFLLIRQEEIRVIGKACFSQINEFEMFIEFYENVKYLLWRIYFSSDREAWQQIQDKLYAGNITLKMLQVMTMVCVGNPKKLWYQLLAYVEQDIRTLLLQGEILKAEFLLKQLDGEARGKLGNIVLRMIQVFYSEVKKDISPTVFDLTRDAEELEAHYIHLKYYLRRLEFSLPETYWQEVYDYIVQTGVSDYFMFHMLQKDIFYKRMFCLNMAEMFAKYEGKQSVRAQLYLQLAENEK